MTEATMVALDLPRFDRHFWDGTFRFTRIGKGSLGGKANGLVGIKDLLSEKVDRAAFPAFTIEVPTMAVIGTRFFDEFMTRNRLGDLAFEEMSDNHIGHAFQQAELPVELLGDLRALIEQVKTPLAIRSSSLLEDALERPFAGVYATKMIPNNQFDPDTRFRKLLEAIKLVYASTCLEKARDYIATTGHHPREEKMAVIIQEVVGRQHGDRFYPEVSGVARSVNFYPSFPARPEDGVASLALGLGKTIVDGGIAWTFSPAFPKRPPPFTSTEEMLRNTQTEFWAVNMGVPPEYDAVNEAEHLALAGLSEAAADEVLHQVASTWDADSRILVPGIRPSGTPVVNFAPLLEGGGVPLSNLIRALLRAAEDAVGGQVEIEFAVTFEERCGQPLSARLGFLQVRPMTSALETVEVTPADLTDGRAIVASDMVIGNAVMDDIYDIVFVRPERFSDECTAAVAQQVSAINRALLAQRRPYLLIGFGRWGSSHRRLGIPVAWSQISGARAIVEATLPQMNPDLSQASHFFHNLSSFRATYFMVRHDRCPGIDWEWLQQQPAEQETEFVRHVRLAAPLLVRVDGRSARGVVLAPQRAGGKQP